MTFEITSPVFADKTKMPALYTCEGRNISPPLQWTAPPAGTKSLVLINDDPDAPDPAAPKMTWVHWVLYNLPPEAGSLPEAVQDKDLPKGTLIGTNDRQFAGYGQYDQGGSRQKNGRAHSGTDRDDRPLCQKGKCLKRIF